MITEDLNVNTFLDISDLTDLSNQIKEINKELINSLDFDADLLLTLDNVKRTVDSINLMVLNREEISDYVKLETVKKLITVHQALLEYRHETSIADKVAKIINQLVILYPVFLFGVVLNED